MPVNVAAIGTRPLSWRTGTEVIGIDARNADHLAESVIADLWRLHGELGILLFHDQHHDHEQHLAFIRCSGPPVNAGLFTSTIAGDQAT